MDVVFTLSRPLIKNKPIELHCEIPENLPLLDADENRLQQILTNLVGNGLKFTHAGEVRVSAVIEENQVGIYVADTGIGIQEENFEQIFETFKQGDGSTARHYGGTGLGLAVTRKLIELHQSTIHLKSKPGEGSTFWFSLPVATKQTLSGKNSVSHVAYHPLQIDDSEQIPEISDDTNTKTILVVDDEPVNLEVLKNQLRLYHYKVLAVDNGYEAMEILKSHKPDLVLLDLMMPGMSGYEVCQRIREIYDPTLLPVIVVSAKNQVEDLVKGLELGANDYIVKPFSRDELIARIRTHLTLSDISELLAGAKYRLELLLLCSKELVVTDNHFQAVSRALYFTIRKLKLAEHCHLRWAYKHRLSSGESEYVHYEMELCSSEIQKLLSLNQDELTSVHAQMPEGFLQEVNISENSSYQSKGNLLHLDIVYKSQLSAIFEIQGLVTENLLPEDQEYLETLSGFLATVLDDLSFTLDLEIKVHERTQQLQESMHQLEQQNTQLTASNKKLEELNDVKGQLLDKLRDIYENYWVSLKNQIEILRTETINEPGTFIRGLLRDVHHIDELMEPIKSLYDTEKSIQSKRVLLCETNKKQQIIAKMALRGTGVDLDIVTTHEEGQALIEQKNYDIVLADNNLISLAKLACERNSQAKTVFMTSENASHYWNVLLEHPFLSNIVSRSDDDRTFTIKNILTTVSKLVNTDLFGLEKYLSWGVEVKEHAVINSNDRPVLIAEMEQYLKELGLRSRIITQANMVAEELLMNAIYDAPRDLHGREKYNHLSRIVPVQLETHEQGRFRYACDGLLLAVSVEDPFGALGRQTILDYLRTCYQGQEGSLNEHKGGAGRGLFEIMETSDLLVMNVKSNVKTEIISIFNIDPNKPKTGNSTSFHYFHT
ncbi:MAG: response regulator [SAR324 cluster bacterium]|nr:response regulator [SAR324 cluster bacterium]